MKTPIFFALLLPMVMNAQVTFEESNESFNGLIAACPVVIDINNDNISDLFLNGYDTVDDVAKALFYTNDGSAHFTLDGMTVEEFSNGGAVAEDFDNDGDKDLFYVGYNPVLNAPIFNYFENLGNGNFNNKPCNNALNTLGLFAVTVSVADVDADGNLDIFYSGDNSTEEKAYLLLNDGSGCFTVSPQVFEGAANNGGSVLADLDNNGYPDLVYFGVNGQHIVTNVILNTNGVFGNPVVNTGLSLISSGEVAAAHLNGDQFIDLVYQGNSSDGTRQTKVCFGNGDGTFICEEQSFPQITYGSVLLEDFDNDGDKDCFLHGRLLDSNLTKVSKLYLNDGNGNFIDSGQSFIGIDMGKAVAFYANDDAYLDIFISGNYGVFPLIEPISKLYINTTPLKVEEFTSKQVILYPNPTHGLVNIELNETIFNPDVHVTDMSGKRSDIPFLSDQIDISTLSSGTYLITITVRGNSITQRIIKQ